MSFSPGHDQSRREFFRSAARYGLAAGLVSVAAVAARTKPGCVNRGVCGSCGLFAGCELPSAITTRQSMKGATP